MKSTPTALIIFLYGFRKYINKRMGGGSESTMEVTETVLEVKETQV